MLRTISSLNGHSIHATDGELGHVKKFYIDEEKWGVRYLVVETGPWLFKRAVLLSPYSIKSIKDDKAVINVSLSREQIKSAPQVDTNTRLSRHVESDYALYYGYDHYWAGPDLWGASPYPIMHMSGTTGLRPVTTHAEESGPLAKTAADGTESHLRDSEELHSYDIEGSDGDIGHVEDFIFDDKSWTVHYLIVDTRNWWPGGKKVLIAIHWIESIDWMAHSVQVNLTQEQIKNSPEYHPDITLNRDYETNLYSHYGRKADWD